MRIALFHDVPSGGAKRAVYEWIRRLVRNHSVHVYTLSTAEHAFCDIRPLVAAHHEYRFTPSRLFSSPFGRLNRLQRWRDLRALRRLCRRVAADIDAAGYDVVFTHTCQWTVIPPLLEFLRTPTVHALHEHLRGGPPAAGSPQTRLRTWLDRGDPLIPLELGYLDRLQRRNLDSTTRLLANSAFTQACMAEDYGVSAVPVPYGVDCDLFRPMHGVQRENHVLSVGELSPRKGFEFLVRALALLPEHCRPVLRLACNSVDEEHRARVERVARELRVRLQIVVGLDTAALRHEYNRACLCVYAPVQEPLGLVPLEAMACGTAVLGVDEGGVRETVVHGRTGVLVQRDERAFAEALLDLLASPRELSAYGANGRQHVLSEWTWESSTAAIEAHLHEVAFGASPADQRCAAERLAIASSNTDSSRSM